MGLIYFWEVLVCVVAITGGYWGGGVPGYWEGLVRVGRWRRELGALGYREVLGPPPPPIAMVTVKPPFQPPPGICAIKRFISKI